MHSVKAELGALLAGREVDLAVQQSATRRKKVLIANSDGLLAEDDIRATQATVSRDLDGQDGGCSELTFAKGDLAALNYHTDLPAHLPKERIAVTGEGYSAVIDNWRSLRSTKLTGASALPAWLGGPARGKGHDQVLSAFLAGIPVPLAEIEEVSRWSIRMQGMKAAKS